MGGLWHRRAITGAAAIAVAVGAGILTLITKNNWWSYTMAVGFIAALLASAALATVFAPVTAWLYGRPQ